MGTLPTYTKLTYVDDITPPAISADNLNKNEAQIDALTVQVNKDQSNIASEYSPSATYAVGDYRLYNGALYRCTTAITTPEAWNSAHWTAIPAMDEIAPLVYPNAGSHNGVFRGKNITANVTDGSFYTNIKNGTFKDIYIGDYFTKTVNGTAFVFRVAGLDVYLHRGSAEFTSHHAVIVPDGIFGKFQMNSSDTTAGGYVGSAMYTSVLPIWAGYLATAFGPNLLTNKELLSNAINGDLPSGWAWYDSKVNLMTSEEAVGHGEFGMSGYNYGYNIGIAYGQLPLFRLAPEFICNREIWWLRNITSAAAFAIMDNYGDLTDRTASDTWGLRPRFLLG
ncbi:MAG: hypothetical protein KA953_00545 [Lachnospiraceae bacterium]|nr:hypothetical protein [Lachnospiraceae bacterium]